MRILRALLSFFALVTFAAPGARPAAAAATPRDGMVVSTVWLAEHLTDPNLVLLHVGEEGKYAAKHIAGARFVSLTAISAPMDHSPNSTALMLEMLPADQLRARLAALGISDNSRVVVYYAQEWVSPSTRVIFTLDYAGLGASASLLDGGLDAWVGDGHPVTDVVPPARTGALSALKVKPLVVDAEFVQTHLKAPTFAVVDARDAVFYDGVEEGGPRDHRKAGHIAGARSVPFTQVTNDQLRLKSPAELEALFTKAGVQPGDTVIGYCHIGQQATAMLFAARSLGHPVLLYDGSFEDWARRDLPVDNPSKKDKERP